MADSSAVTGPTRALVIANPVSGTHDPRAVDEIAGMCEATLRQTEVHFTTGPGNATAAVRSALERPEGAAPDLVVAVGGDGTVREVVQGLAGAPGRAALLAVPLGTGNSGYKMLWDDRPWTDALKAVLDDSGPGGSARVRHLDLALLVGTGNLVYLGSCTGVIAQALVTAADIPLVGRGRYARAFAETAAAYEPYPGRVVVDGKTVHEGPTVLANIGGGPYRGGQYLVLPHSRLDDGLLDVCVIGDGVKATEVPGLTLTAAHLDHPATVYARGRRITLERTDGGPLPLEHDGEYQYGIGSSATFEVRPGELAVWAPAAHR